eukprot:5588745-Prymnesium_polylepis.1
MVTAPARPACTPRPTPTRRTSTRQRVTRASLRLLRRAGRPRVTWACVPRVTWACVPRVTWACVPRVTWALARHSAVEWRGASS